MDWLLIYIRHGILDLKCLAGSSISTRSVYSNAAMLGSTYQTPALHRVASHLRIVISLASSLFFGLWPEMLKRYQLFYYLARSRDGESEMMTVVKMQL